MADFTDGIFFNFFKCDSFLMLSKKVLDSTQRIFDQGLQLC